MGEIRTFFPAQQQGFCFGTVVSSEPSPGCKTKNLPQGEWMASTKNCQDMALKTKKKSSTKHYQSIHKILSLKRAQSPFQFLILSLREGRREPHLLFLVQAWPLLLTLTEFYLTKVPFQIFLRITVLKTKMHGYAAVKYLKLSTALSVQQFCLWKSTLIGEIKSREGHSKTPVCVSQTCISRENIPENERKR